MSGTRERVVLRADASPRIGLGHVKRCLALAESLKSAGCDVLLLSRDLGVDVRSVAALQSVEVEMLSRPSPHHAITPDVPHGSWAGVSWTKDAKDSIAAIAGSHVGWVIIDHYSFDARWHQMVAQGSGGAIAAIDDLADRPIDATIVVDHNHADDHRAKYGAFVSPRARILGGPRFALLSSTYADAMPYLFRERVASIGIFMGGFDAPNWSSIVVRACREQAGFAGPIEIVTSDRNPNLRSLRALSERWPQTSIETDLPHLADFFARHDLQIGAGGGAMLERCRVGAPTLALVCAENQRAGVSALKGVGAVATVGRLDDRSAHVIGGAVRMLIDDPQARRQVSEAGRVLVDGHGARRVAVALCSRQVALRAARHEDAALIYNWRNHASTRLHSTNRAEIPWSTHVAWLDRVLCDPDRTLQVATIGTIPIGVIRFDGISRPQAEVSLYLDPGLHGLGLGRSLLEMGEKHVQQRVRNLRSIQATVQESHVASKRMFEVSGYVPTGDDRLVKELSESRQDR